MATKVKSFAAILFLVQICSVPAQHCFNNTNQCGEGNVCCHNQCQYGSDCVGKFCSKESDCLQDESCCGSECWSGLTCYGHSCSLGSDCSSYEVCCRGVCGSSCDDTGSSFSTIIGTIFSVCGVGVVILIYVALCWCRRRRRVGLCVVNASQPTRIITATSVHTNYRQLPSCPPMQEQNFYHPQPQQYHQTVAPEVSQPTYAPPPYEE